MADLNIAVQIAAETGGATSGIHAVSGALERLNGAAAVAASGTHGVTSALAQHGQAAAAAKQSAHEMGSALERLGDMAKHPTHALAELAHGLREFGMARFGVEAIIDIVHGFFEGAVQAETATAKLNAVIASTGGVAGVSATAAQELASSLRNVTKFDDEAIVSAEHMLLTFTNIGANIFPHATEAVLNVSTALGQDLQTSAIQVGKALQDPIGGITNLRRVGVELTHDQEELIKKLISVGDVAGAQGIILKELETEFGGLARAAGATAAGAIARFSNELGEAEKVIGGVVLRALGALAEHLIPIVHAFAESLPGALQFATGAFEAVTEAVGRVLSAFAPLGQAIAQAFAPIGPAIAQAFEQLKSGHLAGAFETIWTAINDTLRNILSSIVAFGRSMFGAGFDLIVSLAQGIVDGAASAVTTAIDFVASLIASFFIGSSPPPAGPLSEIQKGGAKLMTAYGEGMQSGLGAVQKSADEVAEVLERVNTSMTLGAGREALGAAAGHMRDLKGLSKDVGENIESLAGLMRELDHAAGGLKNTITAIKDEQTALLDPLEAQLRGLKGHMDVGNEQKKLELEMKDLGLRRAEIAAKGHADQEKAIHAQREQISLQKEAITIDERVKKIKEEQLAIPIRAQIEQIKDAHQALLDPLERQLHLIEAQKREVEFQRAEWQALKKDIADAMPEKAGGGGGVHTPSVGGARVALPTTDEIAEGAKDRMVAAGKAAAEHFANGLSEALKANLGQAVAGASGAALGAAVLGPIGAVAGAGLGVAFVTAVNKELTSHGIDVGALLGQLQERLGTLFESLRLGETLATAVNRAFGDLIPPGLNPILDAVDAAFKRVKQTIVEVGQGLREGGLGGAIAALLPALTSLGADIRAAFGKIDWASVWSAVGAAAASAFATLGSIAAGLETWMGQQWAKVDWGKIWGGVGGAASALFSGFGAIVGALGAWLGEQWGKVDWGKVWGAVTTAASGLFSGFGSIIGGIEAWLKEQWSRIDWPKTWATVGGVASGLFSGFGSIAAAVATWLGDQWAKVDWPKVWGTVGAVAQGAFFGFGSIAAAVGTWMADQWSKIDWPKTWATVAGLAQAAFVGLGSIAAAIQAWLGEQWAKIDWAKAWALISSAAGAAFAGFGSIVGAVEAWLARELSKVDWKTTASASPAGAGIASGIADSLAKADLKATAGAAVGAPALVGGIITSIVKAIDEINVEPIGEALGRALVRGVRRLPELLTGLDDALHAGEAKIAFAIDGLLEDGVADGTKLAAPNVAGKISAWVRGYWGGILAELGAVSIAPAVAAWLRANFGQPIDDARKEQQAAFATGFAPLAGVVEGQWDGTFKAIRARLDDIDKAVDATWKGIQKTIEDKSTPIKDKAESTWEAVRKATRDKNEEARDWVETKWEAMRALVEQKGEATRGLAETKWEAIRALVERKSDDARGSVSTTWEGIRSLFEDKSDLIKDKAESAWEAVRRATEEKSEAARQAVETKWAAIKKLVDDVMDPILKKVAEIWGKVIDVTKEKLAEAAKKVQEWTEAVIEILKGAVADTFKAALALGQSIVDAMIQAIKDGLGAVRDVIIAMVRAAIAAALAALGNPRSPSPVFVEIGHSIPEGLVQGIQDGAPAAIGAMQGLISGLLRGALGTGGIPLSIGGIRQEIIDQVGHLVDDLKAFAHARAVDWMDLILKSGSFGKDRPAKLEEGLNAAAEALLTGIEDVTQTAAKKLTTIHDNMVKALKNATEEATRSIGDLIIQSEQQIQDLRENLMESRALADRRGVFAEQQREQSRIRKEGIEDSEAKLRLARDMAALEPKIAKEALALTAQYQQDAAKDITDKERVALKTRLDEALVALQKRLADERDAILDRFKAGEDDRLHRRQLQADDEAFAKKQALERQLFENRIADEQLQKQIARIEYERDKRIKAIKEALEEKRAAILADADQERADTIAALQQKIEDLKKEYLDKLKKIFHDAGVDDKNFMQGITNDVTKMVSDSMAQIAKLVDALGKLPQNLPALPGTPGAPAIPGPFLGPGPGPSIPATGFPTRQATSVTNFNLTVQPQTADLSAQDLERLFARMQLLAGR